MNKNKKFYRHFNMISDAFLTFLAYFCAISIRFDVLGGVVSISLWSSHFIITAALYSVVIVTVYAALRLYSPERPRPAADCFLIAALNGFGVITLMALLYTLRIMDFSRLALAIFWFISSGLVIGKRIVLNAAVRRGQRSGKHLKHIAVIGSGSLANRYIQDVLNDPASDCRIDGIIGTSDCDGCPHWGSYDHLEQLLAEHPIDELVVALEPEEAPMMKQILQAAGHEGIRLTLIPIFNEFIPAAPMIRRVGNTTLINLRSTRLDHPGWAMVKRGMDILGSAVLILLFSPVMLVTALGVRLSSPGPVIFHQERIGKDKKPFQMLKFRSMRLNDASDTAWSAAGDPRKTRFGSFIRRYSLDELPQLFNVLMGDMSLVGPRPEIPYHVERFKHHIPLYLVRQQIRPGMTGWAQVNGLRGDTSIEDRVEYDIWYIENWSLWLDLKILLKTAFGGMVNPAESKKGE